MGGSKVVRSEYLAQWDVGGGCGRRSGHKGATKGPTGHGDQGPRSDEWTGMDVRVYETK